MKKLLTIVVAAAVLMMGGTGAWAADTTDVTVTASIVGTCQFTNAPTLGFGALDQTVATDATATVGLIFWCTNGQAYVLGDETNPLVGDGTFAGTLTGAGNIPYSIAYNNYTGNGLGAGTPITSTLSGTIVNADYINKPVGAYTDTVTFTINP